MTIRTAIVDDEPLARLRIASLLKADNTFEVVAEFGDGASAIRGILEYKPDLIVLDVQMPGADGFSVLAEVAPAHLPAIIFVTAFDKYAVRVFDEHAVDYLVKPFKQDRLSESLARAKETILQRADRGNSERLFSLPRQVAGDRERFVIRVDGKIVFPRNSEAEWIEAAANYLRIHAGSVPFWWPIRSAILRRLLRRKSSSAFTDRLSSILMPSLNTELRRRRIHGASS